MDMYFTLAMHEEMLSEIGVRVEVDEGIVVQGVSGEKSGK